jgi:hypothetical protein
MSELVDRMLKEVLSHTDTQLFSIRVKTLHTSLSTALSPMLRSRDSRFLTLICQSLVCLATNTATPKHIPILSLFGRLSLETSQTRPRLSLIPSLLLENQSGMSDQDLSCFFLMAMTVTAQSTHHAELKDTSSFVMMMTRSLL